MRSLLGSLALALAVLAAGTLGVVAPTAAAPSPAPVAPTQQGAGLVERLERLGVVDSVREVPGLAPQGSRFFRIWFRLPVDHDDADGPRFRLRGTLLHRGTDRPTVLAASGYRVSTWDYAYRYEVTRIVGGNQVDLEHRFFTPSRPADPDWATQLTIRQAAADLHRVVRALQRVYARPWLSTGHSKGGMTMTYHRYFHPDDVAATVAYVAPNDRDDAVDNYAAYLGGIGGTDYADCRADLVAVQRRILEDRDWFRRRVAELGRFTTLGGADRALEIGAIEVYFAFWQYQEAASACARVPGPGAGRSQVWNWVDAVLGWSFLTDRGLRRYTPYYYQAATQLGSPSPYEDELSDLLRYPGLDVAATFVPEGLEPLPAFDTEAMAEVDRWVRSSARRMMFLYGLYDPWSAETFRCESGGGARGCFHYWVLANHGADIAQLRAPDRAGVVARVRRWAGLGASAAQVSAAERRIARGEPLVPGRGVPGR